MSVSTNRELRNFDALDEKSDEVCTFYRKLYQAQNYEQTLATTVKLTQFDHDKLTMSEVLQRIDSFVDPSDPDLDIPNHYHAYATAEMIRARYPENYEYQLVGLIHDLGKILFSFGIDPVWVVGDTFVLGCPFPNNMVFRDLLESHPDLDRPAFIKNETGIYNPGCGLENVLVSFGHDEYLYQILKHNRTRHRLSQRMMNIIRFHSLYPLHGGAYKSLLSESDGTVVDDLKDFNQYDLYSKDGEKFEITGEIKDYYEKLLRVYFPEPLDW